MAVTSRVLEGEWAGGGGVEGFGELGDREPKCHMLWRWGAGSGGASVFPYFCISVFLFLLRFNFIAHLTDFDTIFQQLESTIDALLVFLPFPLS